MDSIRHGTDEQLELYVLGRLSDSESAFLEEHLLYCGECLDRLEAAEEFGLKYTRGIRGWILRLPLSVFRNQGWFWMGAF